ESAKNRQKERNQPKSTNNDDRRGLPLDAESVTGIDHGRSHSDEKSQCCACPRADDEQGRWHGAAHYDERPTKHCQTKRETLHQFQKVPEFLLKLIVLSRHLGGDARIIPLASFTGAIWSLT